RLTKILYFLAVGVAFVGTFASLYFYAARRDAACLVDSAKPGSKRVVDQSDAVYFTVGTLTTAGTGSLTPKSHFCRKVVSFQMVFGIGLLGLGLAGLTAPVRERRPSTGGPKRRVAEGTP